jgi:flavin-dependent dehydrogenase
METFDVVIAGGGPGGSAAGTFLARAGLRVLILEKDRFPRFRIGESLLPYGNDLLREMGVWDKVAASGQFMPKPGAEFCTADGGRQLQFWFENRLGPAYASTFQVDRAKFDELLLDQAASVGCTVRQACPVVGIQPHPDHVVITCDEAGVRREVRARWLIDATGRDALAGRILGIPRLPTQASVRIATYAHFRGVGRHEGPAAGSITISRLRDGWFWFIPLDSERTSVGHVQRTADFKATGRSPGESFTDAVAANAGLASRMQTAERLGDFRTTGDYSFRHGTFAPHPRILLTGDAAGFIDPIFSSGVMIALKSGRSAARLIASRPDRALSPAARRNYTREVTRMMNVYVRMIETFYDDAGFELLMDPQPVLEIPSAVAAVVGGNTELPFRLRWRLEAFYFLARLQRWLPVAPRISTFSGSPERSDSRS